MEGNLASAPAGGEPARFPYATWGPGAAIAGLFVAFSAQSVFAIVIAAAGGVDGDDFTTAASVVLQGLGALAFIAIPLAIATMGRGRVSWREALRRLGLRGFSSSAVAWMGVAIAVYLAFAAVYVALVGEPKQEDVAEAFGSLPFQILLIAIAAPISEEIFFRGMLFGGLRQRMPGLVAALVSAVVFGGLHAFTGISAVPPLIAFGFILALLYEKTGSIVPGILLHALNNSVALAAQ
ncbi:MAG TPA: CPBP family intramembrane glutamic endopeptidase [Solirubrobacterales bacterium]|nr:CPBP family intramembrane glutamic endopeptidase [Solirubrobacterales bacterium]